MRRSRLTTILASAGVAGLLAFTGACGSSSTSTTSSDKAGSSSGSSSSSTAGSDGGSTTDAALTKSNIFTELADAQKKAGSYTFTLKVAAGGQVGGGSGEADTSKDPASVHVSIDQGGSTVESVTVDGILYIKSAAFGPKWIKIDPKSDKGMGALLGSSSSSDPSSALAAFADAATVTKGGSQSVNGVQTTEYDVSVPGSAVAKQSKMGAAFAKDFPKEITYKVFVDGDNLLRRLTNSLTVAGNTVATTIDFADYGKSVSIQAPPASDTTTNFNLGAGASS